MSTRTTPAVVATLLTLALSGCGLDLPRDPDGTLEHIQRSGELRVGVSPHPPFTTAPTSADAAPGGTEVELAEGFAERLGAEAVWVVDGEEALLKQLEEGEIDLLLGGLTAKNPGLTTVGATRPYLTTPEGGQQVAHVMAVVPGENALLSELERYLDGKDR